MDEVGSPARRRGGPAGLSAVQFDTIEGLTELEDLERVYAQLCAEEVTEIFISGNTNKCSLVPLSFMIRKGR